ncbi:MAG: hypothetical protein HYX67_10630 [Candidatus Melainabacteria bacterium]|nr:hypothetical protein [Candidatus Melainabacteria bacterium]
MSFKETFLIDCCNKANTIYEEMSQKPSLCAEKEFTDKNGVVSTLLQSFRQKVHACITSLETFQTIEILQKLPAPAEGMELPEAQKEDVKRLGQIKGEIESTRAKFSSVHIKIGNAETQIKDIQTRIVQETKIVQSFEQFKKERKGLVSTSKRTTLELHKEFELAQKAFEEGKVKVAQLNKEFELCKKQKADLEFDLSQCKRSFQFLKTRFEAEYLALTDLTVRGIFKQFKNGLESEKSAILPTQSSASTVTITVKIDVGYGNSLSLRGNGKGMNWETGIPLTCVGRDQWTITIPAETKFECKLLLNDKSWQVGNNTVAEPGKALSFGTVKFDQQVSERIKTTD